MCKVTELFKTIALRESKFVITATTNSNSTIDQS